MTTTEILVMWCDRCGHLKPTHPVSWLCNTCHNGARRCQQDDAQQDRNRPILRIIEQQERRTA